MSKFIEYLNEAKTSKKVLRQKWMKEYEDIVSKFDRYSGYNINWDNATYLYNRGLTPEEASRKSTSYIFKDSGDIKY